jgi:hypothetical protein
MGGDEKRGEGDVGEGVMWNTTGKWERRCGAWWWRGGGDYVHRMASLDAELHQLPKREVPLHCPLTARPGSTCIAHELNISYPTGNSSPQPYTSEGVEEAPSCPPAWEVLEKSIGIQ